MLAGFLLGLMIGVSLGIAMTTLWSIRLVSEGREKVLLKIGAFACSVCPFCIFARSKPESEIAKIMANVEKNCPFCQAFKKLRLIEKEEEDGLPAQELPENLQQ